MGFTGVGPSSVDAVEGEQMGSLRGFQGRIIDVGDHERPFAGGDDAGGQPADAPEAVDADPKCHGRFLLPAFSSSLGLPGGLANAGRLPGQPLDLARLSLFHAIIAASLLQES
jgi:hypothetical protein